MFEVQEGQPRLLPTAQVSERKGEEEVTDRESSIAAQDWRHLPRPRDREALFWSKVHITSDCWIWTGNKASGYGIILVDGVRRVAHRWGWEQMHGPVPDGLQLDHLCRNRACVRPDHLEPVTCKENLLRGDTWNARNASRTECPQGHPYDAANTRFCAGKRYCRTCERDYQRRRRAEKKGVLL